MRVHGLNARVHMCVRSYARMCASVWVTACARACVRVLECACASVRLGLPGVVICAAPCLSRGQQQGRRLHVQPAPPRGLPALRGAVPRRQRHAGRCDSALTCAYVRRRKHMHTHKTHTYAHALTHTHARVRSMQTSSALCLVACRISCAYWECRAWLVPYAFAVRHVAGAWHLSPGRVPTLPCALTRLELRLT